MKKLFFVFLYLVALSSVFALRTCWTSGDSGEAAVRKVSVEMENKSDGQISWYIA